MQAITKAMPKKERRKFPRVSLGGDVNLMISGIVRTGTLMNVSPSGIQIECRHQLIEQLNKYKNEAGLLPQLEMEFVLPNSELVKSRCSVSYCRRLSQDDYHLGLNFVALSRVDEQRVDEFINHAAAA